MYGDQAKLCASPSDQLTLVFSQYRPFDLVELEQLLEAVGWSRRPAAVRKALDHSLLRVGLWRHDLRVPAWSALPAAPVMVCWRPPSGTWLFILFIRAQDSAAN